MNVQNLVRIKKLEFLIYDKEHELYRQLHAMTRGQIKALVYFMAVEKRIKT